MRYAELVGRENVVAGTDCGLGLRVHPQIAKAKLDGRGRAAREPAALVRRVIRFGLEAFCGAITERLS